ncbi:MAG: glycosyltransferase family 2 protein [Actinomycetota bacterium]|nr:glycosyltransferase family 2 protein [Actinomycetota bacterium]
MRVTAIIVNWNGGAQLAACLDAFLAQDHPDCDVLVVDNASTDGSRDLLERYLRQRKGQTGGGGSHRPALEVIWNATNRGFAGAVNDGLAATDAPTLLVANYDVRPRADYARRVVAALVADPRRGAVQGKLVRTVRAPDGRAVIDTTGHVAFRTRLFRNRGEGEIDVGQWEEPGEIFGVSGALALYRREMLDDVAIDLEGRREVFDEDLFAFWEDVDLDWRAALRGWTAWYEPAAVAEHERGGAGPRRTRRVEQLNFQNRLLTVLKCDSPSRLVRHLPGVAFTTLLKAVELFATVPLAFFAAFSGVRLVPRMWRKRRVVQGRATVGSTAVVDRWFGPFDYRGWVRTWWRRVRGVPPGSPVRGMDIC